MWGCVSVEFSKNKEDFTKDICKFQSYLANAPDNKILEYGNIVQDFFDRDDEFYEGFYFPIGEDFVSLELNNTIQMKDK